ncbi:NarK/NasA family nitrate transporter [Demequina sp. TTPB684]|uniref:MFS transporter n=1 Tax=unclassified Demequina TaxID=2620311 RepID=UPI001CF4C1DC|nr:MULTISPECIES: nitrate/nitrite transporter [unclassified Demequina]MCB2411521.1 NarK/NasA family nitrate transporter [Demequina sp. TTPB684]UPU88891.1 NarK/NasA family nitrate transporter [Demequina sp. TMPB413]
MTTYDKPDARVVDVEPGVVGPGRWIEHWTPENELFWEAKGKAIAFRNLVFSIVAEHIGFSVWLLWSIVVVKLYGTFDESGALVAAGSGGWALTPSQGFTLLAVASGVGAFLRVPYTFAVPLFGGRNWTVISALLLLVPTLGLAWVVGRPETSFAVLLLIAATAGFGGGNFASSMANISFFYPDKEKGWALGLNAAGGNIGVAVAQKLVPVAIGLGGLGLANAGLIYVPLAVAAAVLAFLFMDNLREAKADPKPTAASLKHGHTWLMAFLYIGTFGSFIGYSAAFPTLLKVVFERGDIALAWGFLGALVGSISRPIGGRLADRIGGSVVTAVTFVLMAVAGYSAVLGVQQESLGLFFVSFMALFALTGIGNGSTYRMIPSIFNRIHQDGGEDTDASRLDSKRQAAGAVGIISAVGAFGGFAIPFVYKWANETTGTIVPALQIYIGVFLFMAALTAVFYLRKGARMQHV